MKSKSTNMRSAGRDGWDCNASELYQSLTMESVLSGASKVIKRRCSRSFFGLLKPIGRRGWPVALFSLVSVVTHMHSACGALPKLLTLDESEEVRSVVHVVNLRPCTTARLPARPTSHTTHVD